MISYGRISILLLVALMTMSSAATARSQPPDAQPSGAPESEMQGPVDTAVAAIVATDPSTSAELARAAKILADLGRPNLAKDYLKRIIAAGLNQQQLAELVKRFGSPMFTGMATNQDLLPEARQLADALLEATNRQLQDPRRLVELIKQLQDPSPEVRYAALAGLREARSAAVGAMFGVLTDPSRADEHANVRAALVQMGPDAVLPLLGLLESPDPELSIQAIRVLAAINAKETAIYLLGPYASQTSDPTIRASAAAAIKRLVGVLPSKRQAAGLLARRAKAHFDGSRQIFADIDGQVDISSWDEANRRCVASTYPVDVAALIIAARLARDAYTIIEDDLEIRRLYLATMLEAAAHENGLENPLPYGEGTTLAKAAQFGAAVAEDLLEYSIAGDHVAAAAAAAQILGRIGNADELLRRAAQPAPLVRAARHPDRRLRLAALKAIVQLQPAGPFPGSSYVTESLAFFVGTGGTRRVLMASPRADSLGELVATLAEMGLDVDTATTGRELVRLAIGSPDYELLLIDASIDRPPIDLLLQRLRNDSRTATLRVGLMARSHSFQRADRIAQRDPMTLVFWRPHSDEAIRWQVEQLSKLAPRAFVAFAERQRQAADALALLAELSRSGNKLYDLRRSEGVVLSAIYVPNLGIVAVEVLQNLGTPESQRALVDLASRWSQPMQLRRAALKAFRLNTQAHGILLTTAEISRQYERYNQSEHLDAPTQRILGLILDCIEAPTRVGEEEDAGEKGEEGN